MTPRIAPHENGDVFTWATLLDGARWAFDAALALLLLIALAPLLLAVALLVRLGDDGPALFHQERVGKHQRLFVMYKFRTMRTDTDPALHREYVTRSLTGGDAPHGGEAGVYKLAKDPRVTRVGRFLRRTSIDELPQLFNVLKGDMALVGPRPALHYEIELYRPGHLRRFEVRPGITGLWQVRGRSTVPMDQALDLDVEYVRTRGVWLDLRILVRTVGVVLHGFGAR